MPDKPELTFVIIEGQLSEEAKDRIKEFVAQQRGGASLPMIEVLRIPETDVAKMRRTMLDLASHGLRCDLDPTILYDGTIQDYADHWRRYLWGQDQKVRKRASLALGLGFTPSQFPGDPPGTEPEDPWECGEEDEP